MWSLHTPQARRCEAALQSEPQREGVSHPNIYLAWELFNFRVVELIICCICSISTVQIYARLWRSRGLLCVSSLLLRRRRDASLAACIPSSQ
jgi:hypothetical protein